MPWPCPALSWVFFLEKGKENPPNNIATLPSPQRSSWAFQLFRLFFDSVFNFLDPGAGRPRELIFNSVSNFGPEGPKVGNLWGDGRVAKTTRIFIVPTEPQSEDFSLLVTFLLVTFSWPSSAWKNSVWAFFVAFSWLFRGPHFGQILRVLALEKSSDPKLPSKPIPPKFRGRIFPP